MCVLLPSGKTQNYISAQKERSRLWDHSQGLGCKQAAYDNIAQRPEEPVRSYIVRYSRLFKLLNGMAPNEVKMHTTSMHFVNSLRSYLSSKVENRLLGMNETNYSLGDTFTVALQCELKAIRVRDGTTKEAQPQ